MPEERQSPDRVLSQALDQLALGDLPEPLWHAVAESLDWLDRLDAEAASRGEATRPTRPR
ncbi:hypothetical protein Q5424_03265 [Conexibacter sp. JD483]|uniref:hypothetical protein n=1 Tax=unclassified Conexibacter TaxID=2627773 RepID=UPI002722E355|nr:MULTISPECIES: hypothetical protein [unclassified Conexibacter]MDO8184474.1 hypothetical protein [Conexibacter sp. CPCC 205706]MDO8197780.1 hypothetical protein [Conexibacter sp. CPCC 205762]MDR9368084.1 hypothetical protein [Conexibacter sp. JD483]